MRIVINDYLGRAPQVQLSRALAARGHDVLHLYSADVQSPKGDLTKRPEDAANFTVEGLGLRAPAAKSFCHERFQEWKFGRLVAKRAMAFRPEVVMACNNPLDVQRSLQSSCRQAKIPFVYWMQRFFAMEIDQMIENRAAFLNILIGSYYHALERKLLASSDVIVAPSDDFVGILTESWEVFERQCMVVPSWSPSDSVTPRDKTNAWSRAHGLADKIVALYTGSLGAMEEPLLLLELAQILRPSNVEIVVISEGAGAEILTKEAKARVVLNLRVFPFQPYESYSDVLGSADILLALVDANSAAIFVPSKMNSYLCAGRPIVLSAPWQNLAAKTLEKSGGGQVVPPGDATAMAHAILKFLNDDHLRKDAAARARRFAEEAFEITEIANRFERLFERLCSGIPRRRPQ